MIEIPPTLTDLRLSRRQLLRASIGGSATAILLAACGSTTQTAANTNGIAPTLRLAFQPPYIGVFVLQQQKLLEKAFQGSSIDIEFRSLLSLDPIAEALSGGSVDLGMGGTPIAPISSGQPIRIVALVERSPKTHAVLVTPHSAIKTIADLKGKKIGTPSGKNYVFPLRVLERAGIKDTEVQWLKLENNEGRSALVTGAIDAWVTWDPFYADIQVAKEAVVLVDAQGYYPNYVSLFARSDYLAAYPETIKRFIRAYKQALDYVKANHQAAVNLFVQQNKLSPEVAELTFSRRNYQLSAPNDEFKTDLIDQSKLLHQLGVITQEPDWSKVIDATIAQQALGS